MILVKFDDPQEYHAPGQRARRAKVFIDKEKIGQNDIVVGMSIYGPGMEAPFHAHEGSETIFIVNGRGEFGTRENVVEASFRDVLYFSCGEEHFLRNTGSETLEFLFVYSHSGDEKRLKKNWVPVKKVKWLN